MAKRQKTTAGGEQLDLIDVAPKNAKKIKEVALAFNDARANRVAWLEDENDQKEKLLTLVDAADLQPLENGVIKFRVDGMTITVTPRDKAVKVKEDGEAKADEG